jgi:hypothetical protein
MRHQSFRNTYLTLIKILVLSNMASFSESCINQHGEAARANIDQAVALGEMCLLLNVGFEPELQEVISGLLEQQNPSESGVCDIKVFAKSPEFTAFDRNVIELNNVVKLFDFGKQLYPEDMAEMEVYDQLDEYWNESNIYRLAKDININQFRTWINEIFSENPDEWKLSMHRIIPENPAEDEPQSPDRRDKVVRLVEILSLRLFSDSNRHISMYCTTEDNNENTSFAPYFFIGDSCLVIVAKRWIL